MILFLHTYQYRELKKKSQFTYFKKKSLSSVRILQFLLDIVAASRVKLCADKRAVACLINKHSLPLNQRKVLDRPNSVSLSGEN